MAKKIIEFKQDTESLLKRATLRYEKGDFPSALSFLFKAQKTMPRDLDIALEIASIYGEMRLFDMQLKTLIKILYKGREDAELYKELIKCYFEMDLIEQSLFYYNEAIERGVFDDDMLQELFDADYEVIETPIKMRDKRDNSNIMQLSQKLMSSGDYEFAKQLLETVSSDSYQYVDAVNSLALISLTNDNASKSVEYSQKVLKIDDENVFALAHIIMAYHILGDEVSLKEYTNRLISLDITKVSELSVAAYSMQKIGNSELAVKLLEKLLIISPYSRDHLVVAAIANNNCGNKQRARELLVKANNIYPDDIAISYYSNEIICGENKSHLELTCDLPSKTVAEWTRELDAFIKSFNKDSFSVIGDDIARKIRWAFQTDDWWLQKNLAGALIPTAGWNSFFKELLIAPGYDYRVKREVLRMLLTYTNEKSFSLFISDLYLSFLPKIPRGHYPEEMKLAYWQVYSTLAFIAIDFDLKLNRVFKNLVKIHEEMDSENSLKLNPKVLSALILFRLNMKHVFKDKLDCCEIFNCDLTDFEAYDDIFPAESIERKKKKS